jgi:hypothetical protein
VDFDFCLLEVLGTFVAEAPLAEGFLFLLEPRTSSATLSLSQSGQSHSQEYQARAIAMLSLSF